MKFAWFFGVSVSKKAVLGGTCNTLRRWKTTMDRHSIQRTLSRAKDNLPLFSAGLIFLGYWHLDSYYSWFGIEIYNYVSASEILLSFLSVIKLIVVLLLLAFVYTVMVVSLPNFPKGSGTVKMNEIMNVADTIFDAFEWCFPKFVRSEKPQDRKARLTTLFSIVFRSIMFYLVVEAAYDVYRYTVNDEVFYRNYKKIELRGPIVILIYFNYFLGLFLEKQSRIIKELFAQQFYLISFAVIFFSSSFLSNRYKSIVVINGHSRVIGQIVTDKNEVIHTSNTLSYVGQTQGYIFFRNSQLKQNLIYDKKNIVKTSFQTEIK